MYKKKQKKNMWYLYHEIKLLISGYDIFVISPKSRAVIEAWGILFSLFIWCFTDFII